MVVLLQSILRAKLQNQKCLLPGTNILTVADIECGDSPAADTVVPNSGNECVCLARTWGVHVVVRPSGKTGVFQCL
jgi:hypothetical protein